jgi:hypothetical protein
MSSDRLLYIWHTQWGRLDEAFDLIKNLDEDQLSRFFGGEEWHVDILVSLLHRTTRQLPPGDDSDSDDSDDPDSDSDIPTISFPTIEVLEALMNPMRGGKTWVRTWEDVKAAPYEISLLVRSGGPAAMVQTLIEAVIARSKLDPTTLCKELADDPDDDEPKARLIRDILMQITQPWAPALLDQIGVTTETLGAGYQRWVRVPQGVIVWQTKYMMSYGADKWAQKSWCGNTCDPAIPAAVLAKYPVGISDVGLETLMKGPPVE